MGVGTGEPNDIARPYRDEHEHEHEHEHEQHHNSQPLTGDGASPG